MKDFDPSRWIEKKEMKKMGRFIQFAIAASEFAHEGCGPVQVTPDIAERVGVYIGSGIGGFEVIEREHKNLLEKGPGRISPFFIPATIINLASGYVSIRTRRERAELGHRDGVHDGRARDRRFVQDHSARRCRRDDLRRHRSRITPMGVGGFAAMRALSQRNDEPERASRPWDKHRDGFVVGEGAGILILEELEFAKQRGAPILAEIVGYGMSGDAFHITSPAEDGDGAFRVMRNAMRDARLRARHRSTTSTRTAPPRRSATSSRRSPSSARSATMPTS